MGATGASPRHVESTLDAAARRLASSALPLFAGLGVDIAGARATAALAERLRGVIDHMHSAAVLRDLDPLRESGAMRTTPTEARLRGDVIFVVGAVDGDALRRLAGAPLQAPAQRPRAVYWLAPAGVGPIDGVDAQIISAAPPDLPLWIAALRACVKGRRVSGFERVEEVDRLAAALKAARFGVAVWSASHLHAMEIEALNGLVRDLNDATRFTASPLSQADGASGVLCALGWTTGFPMRTGFGPLGPEHDPWRFDAERMIAQSETDCVVWLSTFATPPPIHLQGAVDVAICDDVSGWETPPPIHLAVGRPGRDHAGVLHDDAAGALVSVAASAPRDLPTVATTLAALAARIDALRSTESAWPC